MSTAVLTPPAQSNWIINKPQDLIFFTGSAIFGYALLFIGLAFGTFPALLTVLLALLIEGPHVYATATRALFDPEERKRIGLTWWVLMLLCCISPVISWLIGFRAFSLLVACWAVYHTAKQHVGFVLIYRRKARERANFRLDKWFTLASQLLPFAFFLSTLILGTMKALPVFLTAGIVMSAIYANQQSRNENRNWPKLILLILFTPLHWFAWIYAATSPSRVLIATLMVNIGHSLQYLRLMWFHNHNRYQTHAGLIGLISKKWVYFVTVAVLLAVPSFVMRQSDNQAISSAALGFLMFHYVLDARIWRVRNDPELAAALNLT
jgi:hypothetical protein